MTFFADSVYEVCDTKIRTLPTIVEEYAVRPSDLVADKEARKSDSYGNVLYILLPY